jgi:hypothetical protein
MPDNVCLACGNVLDAADNLTGKRKPKSGDISVCIDCGHIMAFGEDLSFRPLTDAEMIEIAGHPTIVGIQKARAAVQRERREGKG